MATRKVETAIQEVALAAFYGNAHRAARMLKDVPGEHAAKVMEGALRQWALVVPFVPAAQIEEILAKFSLGIVATNAVAGDPGVESTIETE